MTLLIVPPGTIAAEATSILTRSQVPIISDGILFKKLLKADGLAQAIISLTEDELTILARSASYLLEEAPHILTAVPGLVYPGPWMNVAARMHPMDWLTLESTLTKAGFMANDVDALGHRASRDSVIDNAKTDLARMFSEEDEEENGGIDPLGELEI